MRQIDPSAVVTFLVHDEITVECSEEHKTAVSEKLRELLPVELLRTADFVEMEG